MSGGVCCKCGARPNSIPYCYGGSDYDYHCFCCAQPPKLKCIHCNVWRDLELHEKHDLCIGDKLHVFVYTKIWPPFPEFASEPQEEEAFTSSISPQPLFQQQEEMLEQQQQSPFNETDVISLVSDQEDEVNTPPDYMSDIKPKPKLLSSDYWVTVKQIRQWDNCPRCGLKREKQSGWVSHAQKCAQDPKYKKRKFFMYVHTKGWCNYLVQDSAWHRHSNPETGACKTCRLARQQGLLLPYQPKPPPRPNEEHLARMRRYNKRKTKLKNKIFMLSVND